MYRKPIFNLLALSLVLTIAACSTQAPSPTPSLNKEGGTREPMAFALESSALNEGGTIPTRYTCEGADVSPEIHWQDTPDSTQSYVLIVDDPDAPGGIFTHWVLFNVPAERTTLPEALEPDTTGVSGQNDFGRAGYGGPCPPQGHGPHRYFFTLYALNIPNLNLSAGATRSHVEQAMQGHVIGQAQIMGRYER